MMAVSQGQAVISDKNVHQTGQPRYTALHRFGIVAENLLPGSGVKGMDHLEELLKPPRVAGEPCLLLLEHYSNFDLPVLHYLLQEVGPFKGVALADALLAIAGIKLNESNPDRPRPSPRLTRGWSSIPAARSR